MLHTEFLGLLKISDLHQWVFFGPAEKDLPLFGAGLIFYIGE